MNTKQLKAKVLDLAIHGKLLSPETIAELKKSPDYETADVLLEKIRKEKEEKIAKGELKRDKKDSYIFVGDDKRHYEKFADGTVKDIEDEIPFDVPEEWAWCRLGNIGKWQSGTTPNKKNLDYYKNGTIPWLLTGDLNDGLVTEIPNCITEKALKETSLKINPIGSVCIAMYGATIGKLGILNTPATTNQACCVCYEFYGINNKYLFYFLKEHKEEFIQQGFGGAQPNISKEKIVDTFIPLPSLSEQECIVKSIETYFEQIDSLEENKYVLQTAIKQTKSKILDLAIHGKLVPQDPNDEPASVLLEKLRAEKEDKIAKGELKRDKNDSYIYKGSDNCYYQRFADGHEDDISEEISFEIPNNWIWCRLRDIGDYKKGPFGSALKKSLFVQKSNNTIKVYEQKNAIQKNHKLGNYYITKDYFNSQMQGFEVLPGDIIVSCAGTIGETYVMPENIEKGIINQALMRMRITRFININYFLMYFDHILKEESAKSGKGTAIKNIPPFDVFKNFLIPIPPYEEQLRIVSKITEFSIKLDSIANNIE